MKYPWIAEAIIEWKLGNCEHEGEEIFCNECGFNNEICDKLSEIAKIVLNDIEDEEGELDDKN